MTALLRTADALGSPQAVWKGGLAAPLFCLGLGAAVLASREPPLLLLAAAAVLVVAAWLARPPRRVFAGPLGVAVPAFGALALGSAWLWGAHYSPVAVYQVALFVAAFGVGRAFAQGGRERSALRILVLAAAAASLWGLWQYAARGELRAEAWFETPNLMAAFVNLALVPLLVLTLLRGPRWAWLSALALLAAGLEATLSRGGLLGATAGIGAAGLLIAERGWRPSAKTVVAVALALAAGYGLAKLAPSLSLSLARLGPAGASSAAGVAAAGPRVTARERADSSEARLELYAVAVRHLADHPILGSGYLGFGRLFRRERAAVPSYAPGVTTDFVHDDYLQVLLELGPIGLAAFLGITVLPLWLAYRAKPALDPTSGEGALRVAVFAGLAGMVTHALVDFPFYVPGTLAGYGLLLGLAAEWLHPAPALRSRPGSPAQRVLRAGLVALAAYALAMPAAAAGCGAVARARLRHGDVAGAVYWLQVARNFDPRDWRRYAQLGSLLAQQAVLLHSPKVAQLAADTFAAGMRADPGDVHNRLGWLNVERQFGPRLARPATPAELRSRLDEVVRLAPLDTAVRVERVLVLRHLGETARARAAAEALERDFPDDPGVRRLLAARARG